MDKYLTFYYLSFAKGFKMLEYTQEKEYEWVSKTSLKGDFSERVFTIKCNMNSKER